MTWFNIQGLHKINKTYMQGVQCHLCRNKTKNFMEKGKKKKYNVGIWTKSLYTIFCLSGCDCVQIKVYEREKLYKEVWAEPMTKVAERYNISDVALKKTCKKLNIPVPGRGYWAKVYSGEKIKIPSLPKQDGNDKIITRSYSGSSENKTKALTNSDRLIFLPGEQREKALDLCGSIVVPNELIKPHDLVKSTIQYFKSRKDSTKPQVNKVLNFTATDEQKERVYIFLDTLFKAFEELGYTVDIREPKSKYYYNYEPRVHDNVTFISLGQDSIPVIIREKQQRIDHIPTEKELEEKKKYSFMTVPRYDTVYAGKLIFNIDEYIAKRKSWCDNQKSKIESEIGNIIIAIMETIEAVKQRR